MCARAQAISAALHCMDEIEDMGLVPADVRAELRTVEALIQSERLYDALWKVLRALNETNQWVSAMCSGRLGGSYSKLAERARSYLSEAW